MLLQSFSFHVGGLSESKYITVEMIALVHNFSSEMIKIRN